MGNPYISMWDENILPDGWTVEFDGLAIPYLRNHTTGYMLLLGPTTYQGRVCILMCDQDTHNLRGERIKFYSLENAFLYHKAITTEEQSNEDGDKKGDRSLSQAS